MAPILTDPTVSNSQEVQDSQSLMLEGNGIQSATQDRSDLIADPDEGFQDQVTDLIEGLNEDSPTQEEAIVLDNSPEAIAQLRERAATLAPEATRALGESVVLESVLDLAKKGLAGGITIEEEVKQKVERAIDRKLGGKSSGSLQDTKFRDALQQATGDHVRGLSQELSEARMILQDYQRAFQQTTFIASRFVGQPEQFQLELAMQAQDHSPPSFLSENKEIIAKLAGLHIDEEGNYRAVPIGPWSDRDVVLEVRVADRAATGPERYSPSDDPTKVPSYTPAELRRFVSEFEQTITKRDGLNEQVAELPLQSETRAAVEDVMRSGPGLGTMISNYEDRLSDLQAKQAIYLQVFGRDK